MTAFERPTIDLDGSWSFIPDPDRRHAPDALPAGVPVVVPGSWEASVPGSRGIVHAWYRRSFDVPGGWLGGRVRLRFGACLERCRAWLNGREVGGAQIAWTPFTLDVTEAVRFGGANELAVLVSNPFNAFTDYPAFDPAIVDATAQALGPELPLAGLPMGKQNWYGSTSGLTRSVRLERVAPVHLGGIRVQPDLWGARAGVSWSVEAAEDVAGRPAEGSTVLELAVRDSGGAMVAAARIDVPRSGRGEASLRIPDPRPWGIDRPALYRLEATLVRDGVPIDGLVRRFGMRSIETRDGQILLNGEPIYLLGALDQDFWPETLSTPPSRVALDEQMRLARELGLNLLRVHISVPDERYLDAADEAGILTWLELPHWMRFDDEAGERGLRLLESMIETFGDHPSVIAWTIINEGWGTRLRDEARHREWLLAGYERIRRADPTRLVIDNSACGYGPTPNFHVRSDLADFHLYFAQPDHAGQWRSAVEEYAGRPAWLWSPHGDAAPTGSEPLVLSEFGSWGLPDPATLRDVDGRDPWWFSTGIGPARPAGLEERFARFGLKRAWPDPTALARATQWLEFEALQEQIGELRRHPSIQGYVITELTDVYWEPNGLLDLARRPKAFRDRSREVNAPDVVVARFDRRDLAPGEMLRADVTLSSYGPALAGPARVTWVLKVGREAGASGELSLPAWPRATAVRAGTINVVVPEADRPTGATLRLVARDASGRERAATSYRLAIVPGPRRRAVGLPVSVVDDLPGLAERLVAAGHRATPDGDGSVIVSPRLTPALASAVASGARALILARGPAAVPGDAGLPAHVVVHPRHQPPPGRPTLGPIWNLDWLQGWSWVDHAALPGLPAHNPLDHAFEHVAPDHVLLGHPADGWDDVDSALFVGWIHEQVPLVWTVAHGAGSVTFTTFTVHPEAGPVPDALLDALVRRAAGGRTPPPGSVTPG